jgi:hypothetical protein
MQKVSLSSESGINFFGKNISLFFFEVEFIGGDCVKVDWSGSLGELKELFKVFKLLLGIGDGDVFCDSAISLGVSIG